MSETVADSIEIGGGETASEADVKRTLEELQSKTENLEKEVRAERSRRTALESDLGQGTDRAARSRGRDPAGDDPDHRADRDLGRPAVFLAFRDLLEETQTEAKFRTPRLARL